MKAILPEIDFVGMGLGEDFYRLFCRNPRRVFCRRISAMFSRSSSPNSWKGEVGGGLSAGGDELTEPPQSPQSTAEDVQRPAFTMAIAELAADRECWPLRRSLSDRWTLDLRSER
jgi:hypothetical protein